MTSVLSARPEGDRIASRLAHRVGQVKFRLWFESAHIRAAGEALHLTVPNRFVADWIDTHFSDALLEVAQDLLGADAQVQITVDPAPASAAALTAAFAPPPLQPPTPNPQPLSRPRPQATPSPLPPPLSPDSDGLVLRNAAALRYDLGTFIVGPSNELAYTAARRLVDDTPGRINRLFIHGSCGLGKTHLLQGLCRHYAAAHPSARWCYTTAEQFTNQYVQAVRANKLAEFRRRIRHLDLLAIDDVHFFAGKSGTQTEFQHTFDSIDLHGSRVVLASDAHPKLIADMADALTSRFMSGMVVRVEMPDRATRLTVIQSLARRRGLAMLDGAAELLAEQPIRSVREIEGMVTRLAAMATLIRGPHHGAVGHTLVAQFLAAENPSMRARPIRFEQILQTTCERLGVERSALMSKSRHKRIVLARSLVIYLARQLTTLSFPELARALARPNHSTVVTAAQRVTQQITQRNTLDPGEGLGVATIDQLADQLRQQVLALGRAA